ncbi:MAG: hypothetical protein ACTSYA_03420, partial [Candidatus Kariarchaeaceae archaeon]
MIINESEEFKKIINRRNKTRWWATIIYFVVIIACILIPFLIEIKHSNYGMIVSIIVIGGMVLLFAVLFYPNRKRLALPIIADGQLVQTEKTFEPSSIFREEIRLKLIYMLVIPFLILFTGFTGWYLFIGDYYQG